MRPGRDRKLAAGSRAAEYEMRVSGSTYEEIARAGGGIRSTVRHTRAASEEELFALARRRAETFLAHGTTTVEAHESVEEWLRTRIGADAPERPPGL